MIEIDPHDRIDLAGPWAGSKVAICSPLMAISWSLVTWLGCP